MRKVFVEVNAEFSPEGTVVPLSFIWEDGRHFAVDRLIRVCRAASLKAGGTGIRFTVMVRGKETYIWYDDQERRWFMEGK